MNRGPMRNGNPPPLLRRLGLKWILYISFPLVLCVMLLALAKYVSDSFTASMTEGLESRGNALLQNLAGRAVMPFLRNKADLARGSIDDSFSDPDLGFVVLLNPDGTLLTARFRDTARGAELPRCSRRTRSIRARRSSPSTTSNVSRPRSMPKTSSRTQRARRPTRSFSLAVLPGPLLHPASPPCRPAEAPSAAGSTLGCPRPESRPGSRDSGARCSTSWSWGS